MTCSIYIKLFFRKAFTKKNKGTNVLPSQLPQQGCKTACWETTHYWPIPAPLCWLYPPAHMYEARIEWVRESLNPSHVWFEQWTCVQGSNKDFYSIQIFSIIIIAEQTLEQKKITLLDHKIDIPVWLDFRIFFWSTEKSHLLLCQNSAMSYPALKSIFEKLCSELKNINVYIIACWLKCSRVNMSFRWLWTSLLMALKKKEANNWKN